MKLARLSRFQGFLLASGLVIAVVAGASGMVVGRFFEARMLVHEEEQTAQIVHAQARQHLTVADFIPPLGEAQQANFQTFSEGLPGIFRIKVFDPTGRIVWSNEPRLIGRSFPDNVYVGRALRGEVITVLEAPKRTEHVYEQSKGYVAEAYMPVTLPGRHDAVGVIETYKDMTAAFGAIRRTQRTVWALTGTAGGILYIALAFVVWRAWRNERRAIRRLEAQNSELTLIHEFTRAVLQPLGMGSLATTTVETAGSGLNLAGAALYRVAPGNALGLLAGWPTTPPVTPPPGDLVAAAVETRREVTGGAWVVLPMLTPDGTEHVFAAEFRHPVSEADLPAVRILEIMLHEAAVALSNVELFTETWEAHERLAAILAGIADRMVIVDREMRVVWMNAAAAENRSRGSAGIGLPCFEVFGNEPATCQGCPVVRTLDSGKVERGVRIQRLPGGDVRYLDLVAAPLRDASGRVHQVIEVARDITELVEMEDRLKESTARLEQSHAELLAKADELERANLALRETQAQLVAKERLAAVGEVVVGLHHAILNPLTGILGALQVLKQEERLGPRTLEALSQAEGEIRKIESVVRRLPALRRTVGTRYVGTTTMLDLEAPSGESPP